MGGWIKLHRKFVEWEWYRDIPCKVLALHYLLAANFEEKTWQNHRIQRGQLITSLQHLSEQTGLSVQQVRTTNKKLSRSGFCDIQSTNKFTWVTVCNYDVYQGDGTVLRATGNKPFTHVSQGVPQEQKKEKTEKKESFKDALSFFRFLGGLRFENRTGGM